MLLHGPMEGKAQAEVLHRDTLGGISRPAQAPVEGLQHLPVAEADRRLQAQAGGAGEHARQEGREPPVPFGNLHAGAVLQEQLHGTVQQLGLADRLEVRRPVFRLGK